MNMKIRNILLVAIAVMALTISCKKDKETTVQPSLSGMYFEIIPYLRVGQQVKVTPLSVTHPEGKEVGYYWQVDTGQKDTVKKESTPGPVDISKTFSFSEQGTHTIYCGAFAKGYYSSTYSVKVTVVDPELGGMVSDNGIEASEPSVQDVRTGGNVGENTYYFTRIGSLDWMRNNLAYNASGIAYMDSEVTSYPLGRYYNWNEAQTACPDGWRMPTIAEWQSLGTVAGDLMADAKLMGEKFWEFWPKVKITDALQFAAIPAGYAITGASSNRFEGFGDYAAFWSADEYSGNASQAEYVYIFEQDPDVKYGQGDKASLALSVRCVR